MVEAALLSIIFFTLLVGAFDFGQFLFVHQALVERARSAARWGAVTGGTDLTGVQNMVLYNQSTAPANGTSTYFGLTTSMVSVTNTDAHTDNYLLTVKITNFPYKMVSPYVTGSYTGPPIVVSVPLGMYN
jgi:Flp pilus assembly protein TadG